MTKADDKHVSASEAEDAMDPTVGDGVLADAPVLAPRVSLLEGQPTLIIGSAVTIAVAVLQTSLPLPEWLKAGLSVVIAVAGIFGIYARVTPVADPKLADGTRLTP